MKDELNMTACVISSYAYIEKHINYGALFQYYALERVLEDIGISAYWLKYVIQDQSISTKLKHRLRRLFCSKSKEIEKTLESFQKFINEYCKSSKDVYYSEKELEKKLPVADIYITGSDQVWGGTLKPNYLCFVPTEKYKCSYAASFGKDKLSDDQIRQIKPWIDRLDKVSVREVSGVNICNNLGIQSELVLAPTLLVSPNVYPNIDVLTSVDVFGYFLNLTSKKIPSYIVIKDWINSNHLSIKISVTKETYRYVDKQWQEFVSPIEWISNYRQAKYILTNTFHGTVFAIIFHKKFLYFPQEGEHSKQNVRITELLSNLGLANRIFDKNQDLGVQIERDIKWSEVDNKINIQRNISLNYLKKIRQEALCRIK